MTTTTSFSVTGMTCGHCVSAVTDELTIIPGVETVNVTLVPDGESRVTVISEDPVSHDAIDAAIDEAGYQVARP